MSALDRRSFIAMCGALAVGGVSACSATTTSTTPQGTGVVSRPPGTTTVLPAGPITSVAIVGDSLTEASTTAIVTTLNSSGIPKVEIQAKKGRRIEVGNGLGDAPLSGLRTIQAMLAAGAKPDAWVIELGTNDVGSYAKPEQYQALIDKVLALLPGVPIVWLNVYRAEYIDLSNVFNTVLEQRMNARPHSLVAGWFAMANSPKQRVLRADGVHPSDKGVHVLALLILQALQRL